MAGVMYKYVLIISRVLSRCVRPLVCASSTSTPSLILLTLVFIKSYLIGEFVVFHFWFLGEGVLCHSLESLFNIDSFFSTGFKVWYISFWITPTTGTFCGYLWVQISKCHHMLHKTCRDSVLKWRLIPIILLQMCNNKSHMTKHAFSFLKMENNGWKSLIT